MVTIIFIDTISAIMFSGIVAVVDGVIIEGDSRPRFKNKVLHLFVWIKYFAGHGNVIIVLVFRY